MSGNACGRWRTGAIFATLLSLAPAGPAAAARERCGWIQNPTPGNWWLVDRDGQWTIANQGTDSSATLDALPDLSGRDWAVTNAGSYGYGCGCLLVDTDAARRRIVRIAAVRQKSLDACRRDRRLPSP